jgi:hypothetical protein
LYHLKGSILCDEVFKTVPNIVPMTSYIDSKLTPLDQKNLKRFRPLSSEFEVSNRSKIKYNIDGSDNDDEDENNNVENYTDLTSNSLIISSNLEDEKIENDDSYNTKDKIKICQVKTKKGNIHKEDIYNIPYLTEYSPEQIFDFAKNLNQFPKRIFVFGKLIYDLKKFYIFIILITLLLY